MMQLMVKFLVVLAVTKAFAVSPSVPHNPLSVKSFHEWRDEKILLANNQKLLVKAQILRAQAEQNKKSVLVLEKQLSQLQWNLEAARDLSVADYFLLYLSQQAQADRFARAAAKLTTKEVAELMEAYAQTLSSESAAAITRQASDPLGPTPSLGSQASEMLETSR
jgi:hypothetical protein